MKAQQLVQHAPLELQDLPEHAEQLLDLVSAPERLIVHLILVHDVAHQIIVGLDREHLLRDFNPSACLFGAATHDMGKVVVPQELTESGHQHEQIGPSFLQSLGVPTELARFAQTHKSWQTTNVALEDLLVALADTTWKGKRDQDLEQRITRLIAEKTQRDADAVNHMLAAVIETITINAELRMAWFEQFPPPSTNLHE